MLNYGFAFANNKYDAYGVRLSMDMSLKEVVRVKDFFPISNSNDNIQVVKLKLDQLNFTLIAYLRKVLQEQFYKGNEPFKVLLTKPVDIDFEVYIMRHYTEICKRLSAYLE